MLAATAFLVAVSFWPGMAGAAEDSRWVTLYVALPIALAFTPVQRVPLQWLATAFLAWASLTMLWTAVPFDGVAAMLHLGVMACAFVLGGQCTDLRPVYSWLGLGLWASSAIAIAQWFGYQPVVTGWSLVYPPGLFVNPNLMGELAAAVIVALIADRTWWIAAGVLPALALSGCRAAYLALAAAFVVYMAQAVGRRVIVVVGLMVVPISSVMWSYTWGQRLEIWYDVLPGLSLFGWGIGSFYAAFAQFSHVVGADFVQSAHAHNDALELAFELGLPGLALALAIAAACYVAAEIRERMVLVAIGITAMFGFPLHTPTTVFLFGAVAGYAARSWDIVRVWELLRGSALYPGRQRIDAQATTASGSPVSIQP